MAQGLFFLGLGIGILGETWDQKTKIVSWVLLGVGLGSLALSALLWALYTQRHIRKRVKSVRLPKPISVKNNFKRLIKGEGNVELMRGLCFSTESRVLLSSSEKHIIDSHTEWIVEHIEGASVNMESGTSTVPLNPGEIMRIPPFHQERELRIQEIEDTEGLQERAPRLIFHKISCGNEI